MKKITQYCAALAASALLFASCTKDQIAINRLDGEWQMTAERVSQNGGPFVATPSADLGDVKYSFTKCSEKKEDLCDGRIKATFSGLTFEVPFGFRVDDKGETLFIDEDKNEATTDDQNKATILELNKKKNLTFTYTETDGSDSYTYEYDFDYIEE